MAKAGETWCIATKGKGNSGSVLAEGHHLRDRASAKRICDKTKEAIEAALLAGHFNDWLGEES